MKRQRVPIAALDPTKSLLFHQQSLSSVTGCKQPTQLVFPDQTTSIGLVLEHQLKSNFAVASPVSIEQSVDASGSANDEIIILCTPPSTAPQINAEMSLFTFFLILELFYIFVLATSISGLHSVFLALHTAFFAAVAFTLVTFIPIYQAALTATSIFFFSLVFSIDQIAIVVNNAILLFISQKVYDKCSSQVLISHSQELQ